MSELNVRSIDDMYSVLPADPTMIAQFGHFEGAVHSILILRVGFYAMASISLGLLAETKRITIWQLITATKLLPRKLPGEVGKLKCRRYVRAAEPSVRSTLWPGQS